jgi:hypothetical protein
VDIESLNLESRKTPGAAVEEISSGQWNFSLPAGDPTRYRWAQLDDYLSRPRRAFRWVPPLRLEINARVSSSQIPGTWGFGFWNDPFNASLGMGGMARRLPALPNAAWFFYASPPNYLAFSDHHPAQGLLAVVFSSPLIPSPLLAPAVLALPLLAWRPTARLLRGMAPCLIHEDAARLEIDSTLWHHYALVWSKEQVNFLLDGQVVFTTKIAPRGKMGFVLWIDNQYAAFTPNGKVSFGRLGCTEPVWMEVNSIKVQCGDLSSL